MRPLVTLITVLLLTLATASLSSANIPIATDSRIKTLIYNENEIFPLTLQYGYQSHIEFAKNEFIETLSLGNSYAWKITPVERRLFIKPLEGAAHTNMTVITNKRVYQFELESKHPDDGLDKQLVYTVRFFYPQHALDAPRPHIDTKTFLPQLPLYGEDGFNYGYSLQGPETIAPIRVFDDGQDTYLQFKDNNAIIPHIFTLQANRVEKQLSYRRKGEFLVVAQIHPLITLRLGNETVTIFNDKAPNSRATP